jgi:hypothetical protein
MEDVAFDAMTRRASLLSFGVAGLAAAFAGSLAAEAKNTAKKKLKKKQLQKCQAQVGQCDANFTGNCEMSSETPEELQECLDLFLPCCEPLGTCDFIAFFACLPS